MRDVVERSKVGNFLPEAKMSIPDTKVLARVNG
jgi:hypothetical protein